MCASHAVLQKHYRYLEAIALEHGEVEEVTDLTLPDQERITRRAGTLLQQFKELVYTEDYDPNHKPAKRKVTKYACVEGFVAFKKLYMT